MSATTPQAAQQQGPSDAEDAYENQSPNRLQVCPFLPPPHMLPSPSSHLRHETIPSSAYAHHLLCGTGNAESLAEVEMHADHESSCYASMHV